MGPTPETPARATDNDDSRRATTTTASQTTTTTTTAATTTKPPPPPTPTVASSSAYNSDQWGRASRTRMTGRTWPRTTTAPATYSQVAETDSRLSGTVAVTHAADDPTGSDVTAPGDVLAFLYRHAGDWPLMNIEYFPIYEISYDLS